MADMNSPEHRAFRAAGQAVGAVLTGVPIGEVSVENGARVLWGKVSELPARPHLRVLGRILILLMGVGAQQRYSFGVPPEDVVRLMPRTDQPSLMADVEEADSISTELRAGENGLEMTWRYAAELICHSDVWRAVELIAETLLSGPLSAREVTRVCCSVADRREIE
jgi:hypothetical protein